MAALAFPTGHTVFGALCVGLTLCPLLASTLHTRVVNEQRRREASETAETLKKDA
jgi:hypothetical protein